MSIKISIPRTCVYCANIFTAQTTVTRFCSHKCNNAFLKQQEREKRLTESALDTEQQFIKSKIDLLEKGKEAFKVRSVANILDATPKAVYAMIRNGRIRATNLSVRNTRISRDELISFLTRKHETILLPIAKPKIAAQAQIEIISKENGYSMADLSC